jgi:hypothetical protein
VNLNDGSRLWSLGAVCLFALVAVALLGEVWQKGASWVVPYSDHLQDWSMLDRSMQMVQLSDSTFVVSVVAHGATAFIENPADVFATNHCAPLEKGLAVSEPMLTLGLLAAPFFAATRDPILAYNLALIALFVVSGVAMYALVRRWTGSPVGGICAALLYAFDAPRLLDISHPFVYDTSWAVLCLYFAQRLLSGGRWRDAIALMLCGALQLGTSLYPTLAALLVLAPFGPWLLWHYGVARLGWFRPLVIAAGVGLAAAAVFAPFLEIRADDAAPVAVQFFAHWSSYLPGGSIAPALTAAVLALLALRSPARCGEVADAPDARLPLLVGIVLAGVVSLGPNLLGGLVDVYGLLEHLIPGLDTVRAPVRVASGVHFGISILAGFGAARAIDLLRERGLVTPRAVLTALVLVQVVAYPMLRTGALAPFGTAEIVPDDDMLDFYRTLESKGNTGPLVEVPTIHMMDETRRMLLAQYHGRRTSACSGSVLPPERKQVQTLSAKLPDPEAIAGLRALGFTTVVVIHWPEYQKTWRQWVSRLAELPVIHATSGAAAFSLDP